jgi:hypothetical protein
MVSGGSDVHIVLLPTRVPWHSAAYLRFQQRCSAEDHVARHRAWSERYAAEPVTIHPDMLEFRVGRPPRSRDDAMRLAAELIDYAGMFSFDLHRPDETLAARLLESTIWSLGGW